MMRAVSSRASTSPEFMLWTPTGGVPLPEGPARWAVDVVTGLGVGVVAGLMGVGGGIIAVPAFRLLLGMSQQLAQGTSLLAILGAAMSGTRSHAKRGNVSAAHVPWLALGAVAAGPLSSWWVQRLPQATLVRVFAVFLVANALLGWRRGSRAAARAATPANA